MFIVNFWKIFWFLIVFLYVISNNSGDIFLRIKVLIIVKFCFGVFYDIILYTENDFIRYFVKKVFIRGIENEKKTAVDNFDFGNDENIFTKC